MHPAYYETRFRIPVAPLVWPAAFAIISARATTGETWSPERNEQADAALLESLVTSGIWTTRVTGFSPSTGHAEPGYAAELPLGPACDLGARFAQDAIYWVDGDDLFVTHCDGRRMLEPVGTFRARLEVEGQAEK